MTRNLESFGIHLVRFIILLGSIWMNGAIAYYIHTPAIQKQVFFLVYLDI